MTVIDDYLQNIEAAKREQLEQIRALAKQAVPEAEEAISYQMPTLKYRGRPFLGFDARRNHIGIYPYSSEVIEKLKDELRDYGTSSGAIRVPLDRPMPESLLLTVIKTRLQAIEAQAGKRAAPPERQEIADEQLDQVAGGVDASGGFQ